MATTPKWSDFDGSIQKPAMTADEERRHQERKARELRIMVQRGEVALEGNRRLVEKNRVEREGRKGGGVGRGLCDERDGKAGVWFR
ncbi:hypothetical protein IMSHALPRED_004438 [Imshaugia aleurites]|uniref:Uncharacterized protein n=1 Tax=Imshaugia aleurites TaxID=172621 RepID=A0A8H3I8I1_9LECA|nr:hypothetical protein IMSHALPRED_004438 [Imshaugia aleurites]